MTPSAPPWRKSRAPSQTSTWLQTVGKRDTTADDTELDILASTTDELIRAIGAITEHQLTLDTPCADWDLAALVDHVVGGNWYSAQILAGASSDQAMATTMAGFEHGSASVHAAIESCRDQLEAFQGAGVLTGSWHHIAGELTGRQILRLRLHDLIAHTWDINQTVQPPATISTSLAQWGLAELADPTSLMAAHFGVSEADDEPPASDDPGSAYLRALGRRR